jgi:hypothetical protein
MTAWLLFRSDIDFRRAVSVCAVAGNEREEDARALQRRFPSVCCANLPYVPGRHVVALEEVLDAIARERDAHPQAERIRTRTTYPTRRPWVSR